MNRNDATAPPQIRHVPIQIMKDDEHLFSHYSWSNSASKTISNIILTITTMTILLVVLYSISSAKVVRMSNLTSANPDDSNMNVARYVLPLSNRPYFVIVDELREFR